MRKVNIGIIVAIFALLGSTAYADHHAKAPIISKESAHSVSVTLDRLTKIFKSKGITIFARVDHAAGARAYHPKVGTGFGKNDTLKQRS